MLEEEVRACVDEERNTLRVGRVANRLDPARLPISLMEAGAFHHPVFEIDADDTSLEQANDILGEPAIIVAISALEIGGYWRIDRRHDARNNLQSIVDRQVLAVAVALRLCDRPTAGRN